jgi:hypothetical protein
VILSETVPSWLNGENYNYKNDKNLKIDIDEKNINFIRAKRYYEEALKTKIFNSNNNNINNNKISELDSNLRVIVKSLLFMLTYKNYSFLLTPFHYGVEYLTKMLWGF